VAIENLSSSPSAEDRLIQIPIDRLVPHPANANVMSEEWFAKLVANIRSERRYPPVIVRPHPQMDGYFQILDGEHRRKALLLLGYSDVLCYEWPCDDPTALRLEATLNRLVGEDVPVKRAELLAELTSLVSVADLALMLPEDAGQIAGMLALLDLDTERLLADLEEASERRRTDEPRLISFAVTPEDEALVEEAIAAAETGLTGRGRRGRALGIVAREFLKSVRDG
jgi:ParB/RepB/Spo0J family partition protein